MFSPLNRDFWKGLYLYETCFLLFYLILFPRARNNATPGCGRCSRWSPLRCSSSTEGAPRSRSRCSARAKVGVYMYTWCTHQGPALTVDLRCVRTHLLGNIWTALWRKCDNGAKVTAADPDRFRMRMIARWTAKTAL